MIERIEAGGALLAIVLRDRYDEAGVHFVTPDDNALQLGVLKHPRGHRIEPHVHSNTERTVRGVQEVLHLAYGRVLVAFYDGDGAAIAECALGGGDTILLVSGGHGFDILEDTKMIEVKQGPYGGAGEDKLRLEPTSGGAE